MLNENGLTFKDFEKKTFEMICKLGQEYTRDFLERYDTYLMETRDKDAYRNKGKKKTTVKTVYGEVEYERRIYQVTRDDGLTEFVFLLDEQLELVAGEGLGAEVVEPWLLGWRFSGTLGVELGELVAPAV